jgi:predicted Zn finger-like uncharacterized protein
MSMIRVKCPGCSTALNVKDDAAGKVVACPKCKERIKVAAAESDQVDEAPVPPAAKPKGVVSKPAPAPVPKKKAPPPPDEDLDDIEPEEDEAPPSRKKAVTTKPSARSANKRPRDEEPEDLEDDIDDDLEDEEEDEDDRPRKKGKKNKKGKKGKKGAPANTGNIVTGIIFGVIGLLILVAAWVAPMMIELDNPWYPRIFGSIAGVALLAYGIIYFFKE